MITLSTLKDATEQEIFDRVCDHLLKQMAQSKNEKGECVYFGSGEKKCAIGCLISEEEYDFQMEGSSYDSFIEVNGSKDGLLNNLRIVHDDYSPIDWEERLKGIAMTYNLKFNYKETAQ